MNYRAVDGHLIWRLKAEHGVPLDFILDVCAERGVVPVWESLILAARTDGTNISRFLPSLRAMIVETYKVEITDEHFEGAVRYFK